MFNVELAKANEVALKAVQKIAESRIADYIRGLYIQSHNLSMKACRLRNEAELAEASARKCLDLIERIKNGDWEAIEPFELADKQDK